MVTRNCRVPINAGLSQTSFRSHAVQAPSQFFRIIWKNAEDSQVHKIYGGSIKSDRCYASTRVWNHAETTSHGNVVAERSARSSAAPKLRHDMIAFLISKGHSEDYAGYLCDQWKIQNVCN